MDQKSRKKSIILTVVVAIAAISFIADMVTTSRENRNTAPVGANRAPGAASSTVVSIPIPTSTRQLSRATSSAASSVTNLSLPYATSVFYAADWVNDWGTVSAADGVLHIGAASGTTGGDTFLVGSEGWKNYSIDVGVNWKAGETFSIVARENDLGNFVYCDFGAGTATIIERAAGGDNVIGSDPSPNGGAGASYDFGMQVYGNDVSCAVNGQEVAAADAGNGVPAAGGIGFISWDPASHTSAADITSVAVRALAANDITVPFPAPVSVSAPAQSPPPAAAPGPTLPASSLQTATTSMLALPYAESNFVNDSNWEGTWGTLAIASSGYMDIQADASTTGALALLQNSGDWTDYKFSATFDWMKGETADLIARYTDNNNYVRCEYDSEGAGNLRMSLQQNVNGVDQVLVSSGAINSNGIGLQDITASIKVAGGVGTCQFNNFFISDQISSPVVYPLAPPYAGGIGFTIWDPAMNNSRIVVKSIAVLSAQ